MRARQVLALPIALIGLSTSVLGESSRTAEQAAADGTRLLAAGSYSDAARAYTEAIGMSSASPASIGAPRHLQGRPGRLSC